MPISHFAWDVAKTETNSATRANEGVGREKERGEKRGQPKKDTNKHEIDEGEKGKDWVLRRALTLSVRPATWIREIVDQVRRVREDLRVLSGSFKLVG